MKQPPLRRASFMLEPWRAEVVVLHGGTEGALQAYMRATYDITYTPDDNTAGHAFMFNGKPAIVWVYALDDVPILMHELSHVVFAVLRSRGMRTGAATEEAFTYTLECLVRLVLEQDAWTAAA